MGVKTQTILSKMNLKYEKKSSASYNIVENALDQSIYDLALSINSLQADPIANVQKTIV